MALIDQLVATSLEGFRGERPSRSCRLPSQAIWPIPNLLHFHCVRRQEWLGHEELSGSQGAYSMLGSRRGVTVVIGCVESRAIWCSIVGRTGLGGVDLADSW